MSTNDRGDGHRCRFSLQKRTALGYKKKGGYTILHSRNIRSHSII